jgi:hypothetical protein
MDSSRRYVLAIEIGSSSSDGEWVIPSFALRKGGPGLGNWQNTHDFLGRSEVMLEEYTHPSRPKLSELGSNALKQLLDVVVALQSLRNRTLSDEYAVQVARLLSMAQPVLIATLARDIDKASHSE